jgi:FkbH-like protein
MNQTMPRELRAEIDSRLASAEWAEARAALVELWSAERSSATASFVISRFERLRPFVSLVPCRLAILRSFTLEPVVPLLRAAALVGGIDLTVQMGGFDNYAQQMLDPASDLYAFQPDVVILALQTRDVAPAIWENHTAAPASEQEAAARELLSSIGQWVRIFRSRSSASLVLHTLEIPAQPNTGVLDAQSATGQTALLEQINRGLKELAAAHAGLYLLDYDALVARYGRERWHDERKWLVMRMPIAADNLLAMAQEWLRFLHPLTGKIAKVLVTDLDNTLWGGVLGEDGVSGLQVGREYPGAAYLALQRALLDLYQRGVLLAVASKNNEDEVLRALANHPGMLLRREHFAALQANWRSKAESLRRIAEELNVGLDSLAFLDDNPVERQNIRLALPEVHVLEWPANNMLYAKAVRDCPLFERLTLSAEDRARGVYYLQQQQRSELQNGVSSLEDFYYSLEQKVSISRVSHDAVPRVAQLLQKTNQFNLTTRRYGAVELARFVADPDWGVYATQVSDRFGDNGIVGVCLTRRRGEVCEIDALLLSCRVIGRTVEDAILHFLVEENRALGIRRLEGWFLPTAKNKPAESFYPNHQFSLVRETEGGTLWALELEAAAVECPRWIHLNGGALAGPAAPLGEWAHA